MCFVHCLSRKCHAHCFVCVLFDCSLRYCLVHCFVCALFDFLLRLFFMYTVDFLSRQCLAHCLVCVLLTVCYVSAPRNVLHLFC